MTKKISTTSSKIDCNKLLKIVSDKTCGGIVLFLGTVRNYNNKRKVTKLRYTAHLKMALHQLRKIINVAEREYKLKHINVIHRIGILKPGEVSVAVAVSSSHRKEAFAGAKYIIDTLKHDVPIWKEEFYQDGKKWLGEVC
ncbi:MAG: molybdenum cofactor biosynthesis protein MoaE [Planctomycetes bacterium]|nr:molybdenum cofactor biosynthesis protein MoaE [Planctomycetota bacterium]